MRRGRLICPYSRVRRQKKIKKSAIEGEIDRVMRLLSFNITIFVVIIISTTTIAGKTVIVLMDTILICNIFFIVYFIVYFLFSLLGSRATGFAEEYLILLGNSFPKLSESSFYFRLVNIYLLILLLSYPYLCGQPWYIDIKINIKYNILINFMQL